MRGSTPDTHRTTLDQTEAALDGPVTGLTPSAALGLVDYWRTAIADAGDVMDLSGVAAGLSDLRDLLSADTLDGTAIGNTLAGLADATNAAAAQVADERLTPRLERIATNLATAASALGA